MSEVRRRILDQCLQKVAEEGVHAVSFREVARLAGVSHQAPYHHFGDQAGVLRAIADEGFERLGEAMRLAAQGAAHEGPQAVLLAAGQAYLAFARQHLGHFRVMFHRSTAPAPGQPAEGPAAATQAFLMAMAEGIEGAALPPEALATLAWSTVHGMASLWVEGHFEAHLAGRVEGTLAEALRHLAAGLVAPPS